MGGADVGDELTRYEALRERGRGIAAVLAERQRSLAKERESTVDAALIASLEADQARLRDELATIEATAAGLLPEAEDVDRAERGLAEARATFEERWGEGIASPSGRGRRGARPAGWPPPGREPLDGRARAHRRPHRIARRQARPPRRRGRAPARRGRRRRGAACPGSRPSATACSPSAADAEAAVEDAAAALAEADAERRSWAARAEALELGARPGPRRRPAPSAWPRSTAWSAPCSTWSRSTPAGRPAFEAAAADALSAVVVDGAGSARQALAALSAGDAAGAVLALGVGRAARTAPPVGEPVRSHVRSTRPGVDELLDAVVGAAVRVDGDWAAGLDVALAHPDAVVVTADGARFGPGSWRVGGSATGATGAALDEARARVEAAADAVAAATTGSRRRPHPAAPS